MSRNTPDADTKVSGYVTRVSSLAGESGNPGHEVATCLRGAYLSMHRQSDANFAAFGITADQFVILAALNDGTVRTQSEVCRRTYTDPNTLGSMLALLQARGLVRRMKDLQDGRVRTVQLTAKGKRICTKAFAGVETFRVRLTALFTDEELAIFVRHLKRVIQELSPPPRSRKKRKKKTLAVTPDT